MNNPRITFTAIVIVCLSACATPSDIAQPIRELKGKPASDVVGVLGVPHEQGSVLETQFFRYRYSDVRAQGAVSPAITPEGQAVGVPYTQVRKWYCDLDFLIDKNEVVTDVKIHSNSVYYCPRINK